MPKPRKTKFDRTLYLNKTEVRSQYGLTDSLFARLGPCDVERSNPRNRQSPIQFFLRSRVEQWITSNQDAIEEARPAKERAARALATKQDKAFDLEDELLEGLAVYPLPDPQTLEKEARDYYWERYSRDGELSPGALRSYVRHHYSNYEATLTRIGGVVGTRDIYEGLKSLLNARIDKLITEAPAKDAHARAA